MKVWTKEEAASFLKTVANHKYYAFFYLGLKTGARLGELLALRWEDIDFEHSLIRIKHTAANISRKIVSERPGYSSAQITLNRYSHILPNTQSEAVKAIKNIGF
ncbi:hypothetical protein DK28_0215495 [Peptococcaceae bacterium SCADC1_2_3]|nr:hypothetical protein DK28_0215495 [Peptococcaceae bacterium SCADC1_2_3]KFI34761.1 hypothetical protein HY00_09865 [Peptococcaceae bacterium SCADC1_2_3]HBQ27837.1 hypothetical protein [Desulfotomaculum sp.]HCJ78563.1 hypothetical protein [Desulfotomaculum sp.]